MKDSPLKNGNAFYRRGQFREAIKYYDEAIKSNPNLYFIYENIARCHKHLGHYQDAYKFYNKAIARNVKSRAYLEHILKADKYGSIKPSKKTWEKKWENSPGRRILFYTTKDFSGSFYKWALSINLFTSYAVRMVSFTEHQYGYDTDILYPGNNFCKYGFEKLVEESDLIHVKDEYFLYLFNIGNNEVKRFNDQIHILKKFTNKKFVFTHYGGYARKFSRNRDYRDYVKESFDAHIAMTPDLNFDWYDGYFIPHSIDVNKNEYSWRDNNFICHSPSTAIRKGTNEFNKAVSKLNINFNYDQIQNVTHVECINRKKNASIFFDQAGREDEKSLGIDDIIGWYGNSALEAMVFGIPTIAHISNLALEGSRRAGKDISGLPILNTPIDCDGMYDVLNMYFKLSPDERREISIQTRDWTERFHGLEVCATELANVYDLVLN